MRLSCLQVNEIFPEQKMSKESNLLSVRDAATELGLSVACVRAWVASRRITFIRLGRAIRIPRQAVTSLIEQGTVPARERCGR
jgi:excisionase family DNA binding protein